MLLQSYPTWVIAFTSVLEYSVNVSREQKKKPALFLNLIHFVNLEYNFTLNSLGMQVLQWLAASRFLQKYSIRILA
jgi:hypothetical protein